MFEDDDPVFQRVRDLALAMPGAAMKVTHGRPAFFTAKVFAYYGGSQRIDGAWVQHEQAVMVRPDPAEREGLLADPRVFVPAYLGPSGWLGVTLDPDPDAVDWDEVAELVDASFRLTAPARLVRELPS